MSCPSCGSEEKSWRNTVSRRLCADRWHLICDPRRKCRGCGGFIEDGKAVTVTVTRARHVISASSHEKHREATRAVLLEDSSWQRGSSHFSG